MVRNELIAPIRGVALFQALTPLQVSEIARRAERVIFSPGQAIMREGSAADAAVLVIDGKAVRTGGPHLRNGSEDIEPGSLLGEMAMLVETKHTSTIVAHSRVRALRITRNNMHEQMAADRALADHLVEHIAGRLRRLATELDKIQGILALAAA